LALHALTWAAQIKQEGRVWFRRRRALSALWWFECGLTQLPAITRSERAQSPSTLGDARGLRKVRAELNADTIREMHLAFRRGGRAAINKVMKQQPAVFLKLLVLLVPREMKIEHSGGR
jgi:hypothetical protein